jgi:hypothetical protein
MQSQYSISSTVARYLSFPVTHFVEIQHSIRESKYVPHRQTGVVKQNVVAEWLALLLHIREVPCSNIGSETGYTDWGLRVFLQYSQENTGIVP